MLLLNEGSVFLGIIMEIQRQGTKGGEEPPMKGTETLTANI